MKRQVIRKMWSPIIANCLITTPQLATILPMKTVPQRAGNNARQLRQQMKSKRKATGVPLIADGPQQSKRARVEEIEDEDNNNSQQTVTSAINYSKVSVFNISCYVVFLTYVVEPFRTLANVTRSITSTSSLKQMPMDSWVIRVTNITGVIWAITRYLPSPGR